MRVLLNHNGKQVELDYCQGLYSKKKDDQFIPFHYMEQGAEVRSMLAKKKCKWGIKRNSCGNKVPESASKVNKSSLLYIQNKYQNDR